MINRVVLVGRLTKDVEVRKTQTGLSVASFTVACDRRVSKSQDNSQQTADFINCVAWRQSADFLGQYARKGAMVGVDGRLQTRSYDRQDGTKAYVTEVVCDNVNILESKAASAARATQSYDNSSYDNSSYNNYQQPSYQPQPTVYQQPQQATYQPQPAVEDAFSNEQPPLDISNDDLPF